MAWDERVERITNGRWNPHGSYAYDDFIFDNGFKEEDVELSKIIMTYFTNFIKTG